ncbi:MAG TPA: glutamate-5-semialdehyde dehydrogenase [Lentisphaeria bacterium]|nr:MAG: glutamate-5-semialdehyde dehydrogenase [Lentisphaerae bacterium GWF2_38_69]HBM16545.1 glutamate-5-semialdehyde dehydrogenase [Lentisphaeria bacterium]
MKKLSQEELKSALFEMGENALVASRLLATAPSALKNECIEMTAKVIEQDKDHIISENQKDIDAAIKNGLSKAMIDRLRLDETRVEDMVRGLRQIVSLEDPVGEILSSTVRPNGLEIRKISVPIGVIAIIYESRPNVTIDSAALCLKAGNAVILRGGSEAINSNLALVHCITKACQEAVLDRNAVQLIPWTDREAVSVMLKMNQYIDLVIPRGGENLIRKVVAESAIPVIKHYKGVCHIYIDKNCNFKMALNLIENAKCQRPGTCNAAEHLLIHNEIADKIAPKIAERLLPRGVELRGDNIFCGLVKEAKPVTDNEWYEEYNDLILSSRVVPDLDSAIAHINKYGSRHSDCVVTNDKQTAEQFMAQVDSAVVYHNASTRFTDGFEFGMGAEIGISTDKIHARGPMGLKELTSYKYLVYGSGQERK